MVSREFTAPAFPLKLLLLPGETFILHIFEPRYRQLVKDCIENHAHFIMPYKTNDKFYSFGSELRIVEILKVYPDGRLDIVVECVNIIRTSRFSSVLEPKLYGAVQGKPDECFKQPCPHDLHEMIIEYLDKTHKEHSVFLFQTSFTIAQAAIFLNMSEEEKLKFVLADDKIRFLKNLYRFKLEVLKREKQLGNRFIFN